MPPNSATQNDIVNEFLHIIVSYHHTGFVTRLVTSAETLAMPASLVNGVVLLSFLLSRFGIASSACDSVEKYNNVQQSVAERARWGRHLVSEVGNLLDQHANHSEAIVYKDLNLVNPHLPHNHSRFDALGPVGPTCKNLKSYGFGDEEKRVCDVASLYGNQECVIISIGGNNQWVSAIFKCCLGPRALYTLALWRMNLSIEPPIRAAQGFEEDVYRKTNCSVHVFDCTVPESVTAPAAIASRVHFYRYCIGGAQDAEKNVLFITWDGLLDMIKFQHAPAWLKMDIEGYEWEVLPAILAAGDRAPVQISLELHYVTQMKLLSWYGRYKTAAEIALFLDLLWHHKYLLVDRNDNPHCPHCSEILLSRVCID